MSNAISPNCTFYISFQVWQWVHHNATTVEGAKITPGLVNDIAAKESSRLMVDAVSHDKYNDKFRLAGRLVADMMTAPELDDFLTTIAYPHIVEFSGSQCRL